MSVDMTRANAQGAAQQRQAERGRVLRVEAAAEHQRAVRAISWRTRFGACERILLQKKALLEQLPNDAGLRQEVADLEKCYADLLREQPQP